MGRTPPGPLVGVDEAGRGPAIGPMVVAAVAVPSADDLPSCVDDSKAMTPTARSACAETLEARSSVSIGLETVEVAAIDRQGTDMNSLTLDAMADAVAGVIPTEGGGQPTVIADASDRDAARFARRIVGRLPRSCAVRAEHGADATFDVVGAASILAKVRRDRLIADLAREYGEIGSGYPGDPTTRSFLADYVRTHGDLPACARRSWKTCRDVLAMADQADLDRFM